MDSLRIYLSKHALKEQWRQFETSGADSSQFCLQACNAILIGPRACFDDKSRKVQSTEKARAESACSDLQSLRFNCPSTAPLPNSSNFCTTFCTLFLTVDPLSYIDYLFHLNLLRLPSVHPVRLHSPCASTAQTATPDPPPLLQHFLHNISF